MRRVRLHGVISRGRKYFRVVCECCGDEDYWVESLDGVGVHRCKGCRSLFEWKAISPAGVDGRFYHIEVVKI